MSDIVKDLRDYINNTSDVQLRVIAANEIESLRQQLSDAQREAAHWKNNHDTEVRRARILKERTDMPIERVQAYERWCLDLAENAALRQQLASIKRPDFREMREMLRAMQAGELTVSRGIEILEIWSAGNWNDDMLPPVRQDLIEEDSIPVEIIDRLRQQLAEANVEIERLIEEDSILVEIIDRLRQQLAEKEAEIERLKGDTYAGLDIYPNNTESEQQRILVGSVEMGQLLERRKDEGAGNTKTQGIIVLAGIDEYGPILHWHTHWVDFEVGSEFYSDKQLAASLAREQQANECRIALVHQIHELADHIERAEYCINDIDMLKQMRGQRAYAMKVASQWNQNGNPFSTDTTALEAMIAKAGEVMRGRCLNRPHPPYADYLADGFIRALPGVTLEDLK